MGLIKTQGLSNTIISYVGIALGYINFIVLIPYAMLPEQIGLIRILQNSSAFLVPLAQLGTVSVITRFYHFQKDDEAQKYTFLSFNLIVGLIGFIITAVVLYFFKEQIIGLYEVNAPEIADYYYFIPILVFSLLFFEITEAIAANSFATVFTHSLKQLFLRISITLLTVAYLFNKIDFYTFIVWMVVSYVLSFLILVIYLQLKKSIGIRLSEFFTETDFSILKRNLVSEMLRYGAYTILFATGSVLVNYIDTLMLGSMLGLEEVGIYSTALYIAVVIEVPKRAISRIAKPLIAEAWKNEDISVISDIYKKASANQFITGIYALLLIWLNLDYLFKFMPNGEIYAAGKFVVLFIMFSKLIDMAASLNGEIISYSKHYRFNMILVLLLAVLAVATNLIFIPIFGINGAAFASLLTITVYNIVRYAYIKFKFEMTPFTAESLKIAGIGLFTYLIFGFITLPVHPILAILITGTSISVAFWVMVHYFKVSAEINSTINDFLKKLINR